MKLYGKLTAYYYGQYAPLQALYHEALGNWIIGTKSPSLGLIRESKQHYPTCAAAEHALNTHNFEFSSGFGWAPALPFVQAPPISSAEEEEGIAESYGYFDDFYSYSGAD
jgi:hypothetical protein